MKARKSVFFLILVLLLGGCSAKAPEFARFGMKGVTMEHVDKVETKNDGKILTVFTGILPDRFFVEIEDPNRIIGVWPLIGRSLKNDDEIITGVCYSVSKYALMNNPMRILAPMQCMIPGPGKEYFIENEYSFALANKGGRVYLSSPIGFVRGSKHTIIDDRTYNWKQFESKDEEDVSTSQEILREIGKTLPQINEEWHSRIDLANDDVQDIPIVAGDPKWEAFREKLNEDMGVMEAEEKFQGIRLPSGDVVMGPVTESEVQAFIVKNEKLTWWERFLNELSITPVSAEVAAVSLFVSSLSGVKAVFFDREENTVTASGSIQRREYSEHFALLMGIIKKQTLEKRMLENHISNIERR